MNRILLFFISLFFIYPVYSQTIFFHEDFELPSGADSVVSAGNPGWNINTSLAFMSNQSMHSIVAMSDTSILTTKSFNTLGSSNVMLTFHHIAKVSYFDAGIIEVSTDSLNWTHVTGSNAVYLGSPGSTFGPATAWKFNSVTYADWVPGDDSLLPTNAWWKYEAFDISFLLANQANVWIRFKLYDAVATGSFGNYGWLIDNISVTDSISSVLYIGGNIFFDIDSNGIKDSGEPPVRYQPVLITPPNINWLSDYWGIYYKTVLPGSYTSSFSVPTNWTMTTPAVYNVNVTTQSINNLNFGIKPDTLLHETSANLISPFGRCFQKIGYYLKTSNTGTLKPDSVRLIFNSDPNLSFWNATPAPDYITGNIITWTFPGLLPFEFKNVMLYMNLPLPAGDTVTSILITQHLDSAGNILATDIDTSIKIVTCAWDPNDKSVDPPGVQAQNYTLIGEELEYMIRFQNTGNDTAFNVVIVDTLSSNLDINTFKIKSFSHDLTSVEINNNVASFYFNNIMLPDSVVDEPNSHGYIIYTINHLPTITDSTEIENTAYIYFDFNAAVVTNTTLNTMVSQLPVSIPGILNAETIKLYPNPANKYINLTGVKENTQYYISDLSGRIIKTGKLTGENHIINVEVIKAGAYILKIYSVEMTYSIKFFKIE